MIAVHFSDPPPRKKIINDIEKKKIELIAFEKMAPHTLIFASAGRIAERPDYVCIFVFVCSVKISFLATGGSTSFT